MKLQLKFRGATTATHRQRVIERVTHAGAAAVRPLFPNEKDKELAALYIVDIDDPECQAAIRSLLSGEPYVEFVEGEVQRKLKSPAQSSEG